MKLTIESQLSTTEEKLGSLYLPRIIRLCRKFKFTENETKVAVFALVCQCDCDIDSGHGGYGIDCISCCQILNVHLKDMLEFLGKDRLHIQQGFFPEVHDSYILTSALMYDSDFCKSLIGFHLKSDEFLKIEQTLLADVIAEEPGNEHYRYVVL